MWARSKANSLLRAGYLVAVMLVLAACASAPKGDPEALAEFQRINDPLEPTNRAIFSFNLALDKAILKPVTSLYRTIAPEAVREGFHNALLNLKTPVVLANDLLQGEPGRAGDTLARFFINSTIGVLGIGDPATRFGFEQHGEDFGQTLAVWGIGEGPYLMLPIFGPSNPRDVTGRVVDFFLDPINWWAANTGYDSVPIGISASNGIDTRDQLYEILDDLEKSSIDFYASIRSLYRQRRNDDINNGEGTGDDPAPGLSGDFELADPAEEK